MPFIYKKIGIKDNEIKMTRFAILKDLGKISDYEHEHWISEKTIKKMPYLISDPIAIIEDYNEKQKTCVI